MVSAAQMWSAMVSAIKALRRNARVPFDIGDGDHAIMERCDPNFVTMRLTSLSVCSGGRLSTCEWSVAGESLRYVEPNRCLGYNRVFMLIYCGAIDPLRSTRIVTKQVLQLVVHLEMAVLLVNAHRRARMLSLTLRRCINPQGRHRRTRLRMGSVGSARSEDR